MKRQILLIVFLFLLTGCATHQCKVEGDIVHIYIKKPDAEVVYFASSLDKYKLSKAKKINGTTWEVTVPSNDCFKYFYVVDGVLYTPPCRLKENDDFGSANCIYMPNL